MSFIKGKQIKDDSLDLSKIKGGSKTLPATATLGSEKAVADITSLKEFTTKGFVDNAVLTKGEFERVDTEGKVAYGSDLQELIDEAPSGSTIILHSSPWRTTNIIHKNGVNINLNSFDLPRLYDSSTSGKFKVYGKGRVGKVFFSQPSTDVELHCELNSFAADNSLLFESVDYMTVNCFRFALHGELVTKFQGILKVSGSTNAEFHAGGYAVKRSAIRPAGVSGNMYVEYGNSPMIQFDSGYTGQAYITGSWHSNTGAGVINTVSGAGACNIVFDQISVTNFAPYPVVGGSGYPQAITCSSAAAKLIFRGSNMLNSPNWLDLSIGTGTAEVEGEILSASGLNNTGNLVYKTPNRMASTGAVRTLDDGGTVIFSLNKSRHGELTLGGNTNRILQVNHAQNVDNFNLKIINCQGQKLSFTGITDAKYYIFGSMTQITDITLPTSGFAIIEFYKHGNDVFIKSDVTTKQYIDAASLVDHVIETTGGTALGSGVVAYNSAITFATAPAKTAAEVTVNGVSLKLTEDVFFSSDAGVTKRDKPKSGDTLYFDLTSLTYEIEADDEIIIKYFV
jgi:hypothetical protein